MKSFRTRLTRNMTSWFVVFVVILFVITQILVSLQMKVNLERSLSMTTMQMRNHIERRLNDMHASLKYIALKQYLTRYVVDDSDFNRDLVNENLGRELILTSKGEFALYTSSGDISYATSKNCSVINTKHIDNILSGTIEKVFANVYDDKCNRIAIVTPVKYKEYIEGALVVYVSLNEIFKDVSGSISDKFGASLVLGSKVLSHIGNTSNQLMTANLDSLKGVVLQVHMDESLISDAVLKSSLYVGMATIILLVLAVIFIYYRLAPLASRPLDKIQKDIRDVMKDRKNRVKVNSVISEVISVENAFNQLLDHIDVAERDLFNKAHQAGVAENAVSILHNIGNILTSISMRLENTASVDELVSKACLLKKISSSLNGEIQAGSISDFFSGERGPKLTLLLESVGEELSGIASSDDDVYCFIRKQINHISDIISLQQTYSGSDNQIKIRVEPEVIMEDTIKLHKLSLEKFNIEIKREFETDVSIKVNPYGLAQTLSNFLVNAIESIHHKAGDLGTFDSVISLHLYKENNDAVFELADNGAGIDEDVLKNVFNFGFSTKERSSGFGLHDCANYVKANGGDISMSSDGRNKGARVRISFPTYK